MKLSWIPGLRSAAPGMTVIEKYRGKKLDHRRARQGQEGGMARPETLQQNPVGKQSHPVKVSHQPEASLA